MDLSIVIVSYNTSKLTVECVESIIKFTKGISYEIIIVDNNSTDDSVKNLSELSKNSKIKISIIKNTKNYGFGYANNQGIKKSNSESKNILFLNSDTRLYSNAIMETLAIINKSKNIGVISCKLLNADRTIQATGGYFPTLIRVFSWMIIQDLPYVDKIIKPFHPKTGDFYNSEHELDWVTGAFFMIRKDIVDTVGVFDTNYFMYTEETDYCFRIKKSGWKIFYTPICSIVHYGGASSASWSFVTREYDGVKMFYKKHYPSWQFPILRILLKIGAMLRFALYSLIGRKEAANAYAKALVQA